MTRCPKHAWHFLDQCERIAGAVVGGEGLTQVVMAYECESCGKFRYVKPDYHDAFLAKNNVVVAGTPWKKTQDGKNPAWNEVKSLAQRRGEAP